MDASSGDAYTFRGNTFNVSKVSHLVFSQAQVCGNVVNASKLASLSVSNGHFSQCTLAGSSVSHVTIQGLATEALAGAESGDGVAPTGMQAVTFNASKFSRVTLVGGSVLQATAFQAAVVKEWKLADGSAMRNSKVSDAVLADVTMERAKLDRVTLERSKLQVVTLRDVTLDNVLISGAVGHSLTIQGGAWKDVRIHRQAGAWENLLEESRFENCAFTGCEFSGCKFRRTTIRNINIANVTVRNVDFTGMVIEDEAAFRRAAGI